VKRALVVGLGTGSSAGWLAQLPGIERVDVAEIEPAILTVARRCSPVNERVLDNPKVHVFRGDARELLGVARLEYDLIVSEPSNPYRAGIASLYTQDFYQRVLQRLAPHGVFVQWVQSYEIDASTVRTIYATLGSVFPSVETYRGLPADMFLIASRHALERDASVLRARLANEPFPRALRLAWRTEGLEGFLSHFVAGSGFAKAVSEHQRGGIATDDLSPIEFAFGRYLGRGLSFSVASVLKTARARNEGRPPLVGAVDWARVDLEREAFSQTHGSRGEPSLVAEPDRVRLGLIAAWRDGKLEDVVSAFNKLAPDARRAPMLEERVAWTEVAALTGNDQAAPLIQELQRDMPTEAAALRAGWLAKRKDAAGALAAYTEAFQRYRSDPWPDSWVMDRAIRGAQQLGTTHRELAAQLGALFAKPFSVYVNDGRRIEARLLLANVLGPSSQACVDTLAELEPNAVWSLAALQFRAACYAAHQHPLTSIARDELREYLEASPASFADLAP
jgi:hypothetical protein